MFTYLQVHVIHYFGSISPLVVDLRFITPDEKIQHLDLD